MGAAVTMTSSATWTDALSRPLDATPELDGPYPWPKDEPRDDASLLEALKHPGPRASALLYDHFATEVNRLVWVVMGADAEHDDMVHQVFLELLAHVHKVRHAHALRAWVKTVTLNTLRGQLRRRILRRRWRAEDPGSLERHEGVCDDPEARQLLGHVYAIVETLSPELRIMFTLRFIEEQTITQIAQARGCSESTVKRKLSKAQRLFEHKARSVPELAQRLEQSPKWSASHDATPG